MNIDLWEEEYDEFYKGEINLDILEKIQEELNLPLPESYINLMTKRNGFYLMKKYFPTTIPNSWANNSVHIDYLYGIGENPGILDSNELRKEWGIRSKKLLILSVNAPMFICLDYRNTRKKEPSVTFIDVEQSQEIKLANSFQEFINGLVDNIEEGYIDADEPLSQQQIQDYYTMIDDVMANGKPKQIDRVFTKILSTNVELIRYMVEKMRQHENTRVHYYLLLFLWCCAEGDNAGTLSDDYLLEVLTELTSSKNKEVKAIASGNLSKLYKRLNSAG